MYRCSDAVARHWSTRAADVTGEPPSASAHTAALYQTCLAYNNKHTEVKLTRFQGVFEKLQHNTEKMSSRPPKRYKIHLYILILINVVLFA